MCSIFANFSIRRDVVSINWWFCHGHHEPLAGRTFSAKPQSYVTNREVHVKGWRDSGMMMIIMILTISVVIAIMMIITDTWIPSPWFGTPNEVHGWSNSVIKSRSSSLQIWIRWVVDHLPTLRLGNLWRLATWLLSSLQHLRHADAFSHSATASACEKVGQWRLAAKMLETLEGKTPGRLLTYNAAMSACEKAARWEVTRFKK